MNFCSFQLVFKVSKMRTKHSFVGLDEISLIDATTGISCMKDSRRTPPKEFLSDYKVETTTEASNIKDADDKCVFLHDAPF